MTGNSLTANQEVEHIQWAFSLDDAPHLPLTGENHPLRRELAKWMSWANLVTILLAAAIVLGAILGILAEMPPRQIALQCAVMAAAALGFYGLVNLL